MKLLILVDNNNAIAKDGEQIVYIDNDLSMFRDYTTGNVIIMGRVTYEAIGKQLPDRTSIVFTRSNREDKKDLYYVNSIEELDEVLKNFKDKEIFVIGGAAIVNMLWDRLDELIVTRVDIEVEGADTFIPQFDGFELVDKTEIEDPDYRVYHELWKRIKWEF